MSVTMQEGNMPHIYWIDLKNDGVYTECAVMKKDNLGNVYFFPLNAIDDIDKRRLARILTNRNATHFELWDLMSNITLNNGVNALSYFHQLVQVMTPSGRTMRPQQGVVGVGTGGVIDTRGAEARKQIEETASYAARVAADAAADAAARAVRGEASHQPAPAAVTESAPAPVEKPVAKKTTSRKKATSKKATGDSAE